MTLRHFEILKAAADTGSFTKAAEKLYITQSAVSHAIREMEQTAGTALFDRIQKKVSLTKSGALLLEKALPALAAFEQIEREISNLEKDAPISLVSSITASIFYLPPALRAFEQKFPSVCVHTQVVSAAEAMETLKRGEADIAVVEGTVCRQEFFETVPFAQYQLLFVCSPEFPAQEQTFSAEALCKQKLLLREKGSAIRDTFDSALYLKALHADPIMTSVNSSALIAAAKWGLGITLLPNILVEKEIAQNELIPVQVKDLDLTNELYLVWNRDKYLSTPMAELIRCIKTNHTCEH